MNLSQNNVTMPGVLKMMMNVGVRADLPIIESRRVKMLNIIAALCAPFILAFLALNIIQERWVLTTLNLVNMGSLGLLFWMHHRRWYLWAKLLRIAFSICIYTVSGLLYRNGTEYCLIGTLVISILVFDNKWMITSIGLLITAAILTVLHFELPLPDAEAIVPVRLSAIIVISILFIIVAICFFKQIQQDYQKEIEASEQRLIMMNRDKERLLSIVSHDLKGPLSGLEKTLYLYCNDLITREEMLEASESLRKKVSNLNSTLDILLEWSSLGMQGIKTVPRYFSLLELVKEVAAFFEFVALQKNITIAYRIPGDMLLFADRDQLAVVFRNLLNNALKFSYPGGTIELRGSMGAEGVRISVKDSGAGMTEEVRNRLFKGPQKPSFGTSGERGTGLGLLLCKEFVNKNQGTIEVQSSKGKGTCFQIRFQKERAALVPKYEAEAV